MTPSLQSYASFAFGPPKRSISGVTLSTKHIKLDKNFFGLILVDISTAPFFVPTKPSIIRGASAAVFAFSKVDYSFMKAALDHYCEFQQQVSDVPVAFIGLHDESEIVTQVEGHSLAQECGVDYFEMAVDDLQTLDTILKSLLRKVIALKAS